MPLTGRWDRIRNGDAVDFKDKGGVSGPDDDDLLGIPFAEGVRHGGGAVQCNAVGAPAGGERR